MVNKRLYTILAILCIAICQAFGQTRLVGKITGINGEALVGASLQIEGTQKGGISTSDGFYRIENLPEGNVKIIVSYISYQTQTFTTILKSDGDNHLDVVLIPKNEDLQELVVRAKSKEQVKREEPIKIEVIDVDLVRDRSVSLPQLFNQVSGVKVRQNGGVGSTTTININGLQGNAIRFFKDGIPLDYLGNAFNLSLLPVDQLSNVEIYKGVLPVGLGMDALGGAVNLISREATKNNLDLTYSTGSFNTHQTTINGYFNIPKTPLFASISSYYVYSDNNYHILAELEDEETANVSTHEVERFHGGVESEFVEVKTGVKDTKFADLFEVGFAFSNIAKERQNDYRMEHVFGEVMYYEDALIGTAHYTKKLQKLSIDLFGAYSQLHTLNDDTPENSYNWLGEATPYESATHAGESGETQSYKNMYFDYWQFRANLNYQLNSKHKITFNHNAILVDRVGSEQFQNAYSTAGIDLLAIPASYNKNISGLGLISSLFHDKVTNEFMVKRYAIYSRSVAEAYSNVEVIPEVSDNSYGIGNSIKYSIKADRFIRLSYEKATRIPESTEYLGEPERDIMGNPDLTPERSNNINLGLYTNLGASKKLWLDVNTFYRYIEGQIVLQTYTIFQSRYENTDDTRVLGSEFTFKAQPLPALSCNLSVTYQDIRRKNILSKNDLLLLDARRRYIPYFFGNVGFRYCPQKTVLNGLWEFYGNYAYVEQYLLNSIPKAKEPALFGKADANANIIPTQNIVDTGLSYKMKKWPVTLNAEINNLLNAELYDGFRVQKPGRNYRFKIKYSIN